MSGAIFLAVVFIFCEWYPVSDGPPNKSSYYLLHFAILPALPLILSSIAGLVFIPFALIISFFVKDVLRSRLRLLCILFAIIIGITYIVIKLPWRIRRAAFVRVAQRGEILIKAIDTYLSEHGKPPESLNDLVPKYIDKIPGTGIRAYPEFEYLIPQLSPEFSSRYKPLYELRVNCPRGGINWDRFFYWPSQDYPKYIYGGRTERIVKWVYVHE